MEAFLASVARQLYTTHGNDINKLHIVLPSKRACVYFKHYLGEMMEDQQVLISPVIVSMEGFARILAHLQVPDSITLLFELYNIFKKHSKEEKNKDGKITKKEEITLDKFAPLGRGILREFNMIDNNLSEEKAVEMFENLEDVKAIERWAKELGTDGAEQIKKYDLTESLSFWQSLKDTYVEFRKSLLERNIGYGGLAFRTAFNNLDEAIVKENIEKVIFVGFSQTSTIEKELILKLVDKKIAKTYFDSDVYYLDQPHHEAGLFLQDFKRNKHLTTHPDFSQKQIGQHKMEVEIIQVSNIPTQAKVVGDILKKELEGLISENRLEAFTETLNHTAILLPDETLLQPLLHSLPPELEGTKERDIVAQHTNITMGFSFQQTPLFELVESIFRLQENLNREEKNVRLYFKDVIRVVRHPYFQRNLRDREIAQGILKQIQQGKHIYLDFDTLLEWSDQSSLYRAIFFDWEEQYPKAIKQLKFMIEGLAKVFNNEARTPEEIGAEMEGENAFENELLLKLLSTLNRLEEVLPRENIQLKTFRTFLLEALSNINMPFTGLPIAPIQIMGMLESRSLDFDHVIVLSCNEGKLPSKKSVESIIPFDIKMKAGLPTFKDNDKSFAYTFYRLMHKAKKMTFIYTDASNELVGGGEKSRFLLQIETELAPKFKEMISVKNTTLALPLPQITKGVTEIKKDDAIIEKIKERFQKPMSPSSIQKYLKNPLQFLEDVVIKLNDEEEIDEELDFRTFGTLLHGGLELLLKPYIGKVMNREEWNKFSKNDIEIALQRAIKETQSLNYFSLESGKNYLLFQIAQKLITDYFKQQSEEFSKVKMISLEEFYHAEIQITPDLTFKLSGQADRIDFVWKPNGNVALRVVDYKTGNYTPSDLKARTLQEVLDDPDKNKIIQLLAYKYLLLKNLKEPKIANMIPPHVDVDKLEVESGFYFFRKLSDGFIKYKLEEEPHTSKEREAFLNYAENFFKTIVLNMLSEENTISENPVKITI